MYWWIKTPAMVLLALFVSFSAQSARAESILFDDVYTVLGENSDPATFYQSSLGVTFSGTYWGVVGGNGNGDAGNWNLEGTSGSAFLGTNQDLNGSPTIEFAYPVTLSFDVGIRENEEMSFLVTGFDGEQQIVSRSINIDSAGAGPNGAWESINVETPVDRITVEKTSGAYFAFGIDNYQFDVAQHVWTAPAGGIFESGANWNSGSSPSAELAVDVMIQPEYGGTIAGPDATARADEFFLGADRGVATLEIGPGGAMIVESHAGILPSGRITGSGSFIVERGRFGPQGVIDLSEGLQVVAPDGIDIFGRLEGHGVVEAGRDLRNMGLIAAGPGDRMQFTGGPTFNRDRIEAIGTPERPAEISFSSELQNSSNASVIVGRHALLRFDGGLTNRAALALSFGSSDVIGDVVNEDGGSVVVAGNSDVTFYDDFDNSLGGTLSIHEGSTAVFFGALSGAGNVGGGDVQALGDLAPGSSPGVMAFGGDLTLAATSELTIELGGKTSGEFDALEIAGAAELGGSLDVSLLNDFQPQVGDFFRFLDAGAGVCQAFDEVRLPSLGGGAVMRLLYGDTLVGLEVLPELTADFDADGDVDANDLGKWGADFGLNGQSDADGDGDSDGADFFAWQRQLGLSANASAAATVVPEPAAWTLCTLLILVVASRSGFPSATRGS